MNLSKLPITLNSVKDRYLLSAWESPRAFLHKVSATGEHLYVCCWDPVIRRLEIYFKAAEFNFFCRAMAELPHASQSLQPSPLTVMILAADPLSQSLLKQFQARHVSSKQIVLVANKPATLEHTEVRMLSTADRPLLKEYNDEFQAVTRLFEYHCVYYPTPQVSAWGWFPTSERLEGVCFVHCAEPMPEVLYLHVRSKARGNGGGRQLLAAALNWVLTKTHELYYVTADENKAAIRMCQHCGFTIYSSVQSLFLDMYELRRLEREFTGSCF